MLSTFESSPRIDPLGQERIADLLRRIDSLRELLAIGLDDLDYHEKNALVRLLITSATISHRILNVESVVPLEHVIYRAKARKGQASKSLTYREMEVMKSLARGAGVPETAARMGIQESSVRVYTHEAKRKMGLRKTETLVRKARTDLDLDTGILRK